MGTRPHRPVRKRLAHKAAGRATAEANDGEITYGVSRAIIKRETLDTIKHERTKAVYSGTRSKTQMKRKDAVIIAQLRSGHSHKLAAYRNIVDNSTSPTCPYCDIDYETIEHFLQQCPATTTKRIRAFGGAEPPLSVLVENPEAVLNLL